MLHIVSSWLWTYIFFTSKMLCLFSFMLNALLFNVLVVLFICQNSFKTYFSPQFLFAMYPSNGLHTLLDHFKDFSCYSLKKFRLAICCE